MINLSLLRRWLLPGLLVFAALIANGCKGSGANQPAAAASSPPAQPAAAASAPPPAASSAAMQPGPAPGAATPQELEQLVSPIALYPDLLVARILAASTFPTQVVEADRFMSGNPGPMGDALAKQVNAQPWDPSIKSLCQFPSVLKTMSQSLSWTSALGEAYFNQPDDVMAAIQALRLRAKDAGTLKEHARAKVEVEAVPAEQKYRLLKQGARSKRRWAAAGGRHSTRAARDGLCAAIQPDHGVWRPGSGAGRLFGHRNARSRGSGLWRRHAAQLADQRQ